MVELLVIEAAESSLAYDRTTKRRLYAEAGIPESWVVDCTAETIEVHRGPGQEGYREVVSSPARPRCRHWPFPTSR